MSKPMTDQEAMEFVATANPFKILWVIVKGVILAPIAYVVVLFAWGIWQALKQPVLWVLQLIRFILVKFSN